MPLQPSTRVWTLLGPHRGDNNQILALAQALGFPYEEKWLRFNRLRSPQPALLGASFRSLEAGSKAQLEGKPPDLTISTGHRSVPAVRELKRRSGGRMRAIHLGYPRISPSHFDLVVPTPEYPVPDAPNVVRIPFALSPRTATTVKNLDLVLVQTLPEPRRLLVLGGPTLYWKLPVTDMVAALRQLLETTRREGGSVLAVGSPRTPDDLLLAIRSELDSASVPHLFAPPEGPPSYGALIDGADYIFVTADSVAMVADAVMTAKPVGIVPIAKSRLGRALMAVTDRLCPGRRLPPRDLRFFWASLEEHEFGGTLEAPRAARPPDYTELIAERVRRLLEQPPPPATGARDSGR
jgi:mitochondrial fission protein ELM1